MTPPLNVGILGLGWPGHRHAEALLASSTGALYACADSSPERRAEFTRLFAPPRAFATFEEMIADPDLDAVVVCLPNYLHFPMCLAAMGAGKHVLCEKPPTLNVSEMRVLQEEALKRKVVYFFGRQARFSAPVLAARQVIAEGRLGPIYYGKATYIRSRGTPVGIGGWFTEKARSGGGALIDLGVHAIDSAWYLMGCPRPVSASAGIFRNFADLTAGSSVFDVEDGAYGMLRFEGGAVLHFEVSWAANLPDTVPEVSPWGRELRNTDLYGRRATLRLEPLTLFEDQGGTLTTVPLESAGADHAFALQMQNFLDAIASEAEPLNSARDAVFLMEMLDAIYTSGATGREVHLM